MGENEISKNVTYRHTLHHYIYIILSTALQQALVFQLNLKLATWTAVNHPVSSLRGHLGQCQILGPNHFEDFNQFCLQVVLPRSLWPEAIKTQGRDR